MRIEQEHAAKMIHLTDVRQGDLVDTSGMWGFDTETELLAELELAEVDYLEPWFDEGTTWIHFLNLPPLSWNDNEPIVVQRRLNR
jgi:hypothetical protein